ncbi:MAG: glycosyltransferase family 4 protein [Candidatus Micrarchaeota archaeon]|nr:glycosyltransferase family 4 protein [Candidatus Micrarchaeota archaeon]
MKLIIAQSNLTLMGGAERVVLKIAEHYKAKIYTAEYDPERTYGGFRDLDVEVIGRKGLSHILPYGRALQGLSYGMSFYNFRVKDDYDVINAHMAPSHWIRNNNERVLWYCHTPLRDIYDLYKYRLSLKKWHQKPVHIVGARFVRLLDQKVVKKIEFITANSENTRSRLVKYYGRKDSRVLGGGVDYQNYKKGGDGKYFLYPSRISPNKRQDFAIRAFSLFKRRMKGYRLVIVGPVSNDRFYESYYRNIKALGSAVGDVEIITGTDDKRLNGLYSDCTAVLYPPLNEDYGLVPLEGMASSKPVIGVNEGGIKETIEDGKTGILVNSIEDMGNAMVRLAENPSLAEGLGKNGRIRVVKNYSWRGFFKEFDKELRKTKKAVS